MLLRLIAIAAVAVGAIGCNPSASTPVPTLAAVATPSPAELEAIRFRTSVGLRADLGYIRAVAADTSASSIA